MASTLLLKTQMKKWNAAVQFPTDSCFIARIVGGRFGPSSSSGNPMLTLSWEVVQPETYEIGSEVYNIAGVTMDSYHTTAVKASAENGMDEEEAAEKTADCQKRFTDPTEGLWPKLGQDPATINWDNLDYKPVLGKLVHVQISPDIQEQRKNPTAAQIAAAQALGKRPEGDIMLHPKTGQKLVKYWPKIREIFGLAAQQDNVTVAY